MDSYPGSVDTGSLISDTDSLLICAELAVLGACNNCPQCPRSEKTVST